jgi:Tfp pilus assembly protein PilN
MQAINLIPDDSRPGGGAGAIGRSGGVAYVLLGGLAVLVALMTLWAFAGRDSSRARTQLVTLRQQADAAQRQAASVASYGTAVALRTAAAVSVRQVVEQRFAWSSTLDAVARVLPADVSLSMLSGSLPGSTAPTAAPAAPAAVGATSGPSVQLQGCAPSMARVARLMPRMRAVPGVGSVTLGSSTSADATAAATSQDGTSCEHTAFTIALGFAGNGPDAPATPAAPAGTPAAAAPSAVPATTPGATG